MKNNKRIRVERILAAAMMVGSITYAQLEKVEDQDLLNMLDSVNGETTSTQVMNVAETTDEATMPVADADLNAEPEEVMDDLSIEDLPNAEVSSEGSLVSVHLKRVGLEDAINLFAELSGANIIVPELTEAAMVSVNLKDVEWRPALQAILDTYNYELYQRVSSSKVYSVRRRPAGAPEPQVVETFKLQYATVPHVAALLEKLLPPEAKISEFASRNMIVIKSTESSLSEVRAVLDAIDKVRQQVYIESKFMELTDDAQKDLGIDWAVLQSYGMGVESMNHDRTVNDSSTDSTARSYDMFGNRVENSGPPEVDAGGNVIYQPITPSVENLSSKTVTDISTAVLSADDFRIVLSALEQNKGVNVVSNPKVIVANEELANISIITKEPNLRQEREQQLNDQPATTIFTMDPDEPWFKYGIELNVTPSINTSSNITVAIQPSLTRKVTDKPAGDNTYPIISEKVINTVFSLSSGQTAAIGGLTEITEGEEERKVPVLGSIPFIGRLFSWKRTVTGQDETIIFVTVGLANVEQLKDGIDMPGDAELARRQMIRDTNNRILRDQGREYYEAEEQDKLNDMLKVIKLKEEKREARHNQFLEKEAEKEAKREAKESM